MLSPAVVSEERPEELGQAVVGLITERSGGYRKEVGFQKCDRFWRGGEMGFYDLRMLVKF